MSEPQHAQPEQQQATWKRIFLSGACGVLAFLAAPNYDYWFLAWIAYLPLYRLLDRTRPRAAFLWSWLAGFICQLGGYVWMIDLLVRFGHLPSFASFILYLLFAAYQGIYWGFAGWAISYCQRKVPRVPLLLLGPVFFTAAEYLIPLIFDGYQAINQAWVTPIIQIADLTGPFGVTFLLLLANGALYEVIRAPLERRPFPWVRVASVAVVLALTLTYGFVRIHQVEENRNQATKLKVGVVQGNIGIRQKSSAALAAENHNLYLHQSRRLQAEGAELILWPESAYPYWMLREQTHDFPVGDRRRVMQGLDVPVILGLVTASRTEKYPYNSAYLINPDGSIAGRFDKNYLLMFGEHIPFYETFPVFKKWVPAASHFRPGTEVTVFPWKSYKIGPLICYEDIIPTFTRRLARLEPNLLVNLTNDAWFGLSAAPHQHMALSVYRSVELRLDLIRAVNTGVSAVIEATGKVRAKTEVYDPDVQGKVDPVTLLAEAAMMPSPKTVYARVGNLFAFLNVVAGGMLLIWCFVRARRRGLRARRRG